MNKSRNSTFTAGELPSTLEAGVDISKARLDVFFQDEEFQLPNSASGVRRLLKILRLEGGSVRVSLEATGCYTRRLIVGCLEAEMPVSLLNARSVRAFARARGQLAKTDKIDARTIAEYSATFDPIVLDKGWPEREALQQLHKRLDGLIATRAQRRTSLEHYSEPCIRAEIKREIVALGKRIETYQKKIDAIIVKDTKLKKRQKVMRTITGVGPAVSTTLIVHFPELGTLNRKEAAALAGLAPMNRDSGAARGRRTIQAGRAEPRKALYMAALTAAHRNPMFMPFYKSLIQRGKPVKVALTAVARKLLILINSKLKESTQFT